MGTFDDVQQQVGTAPPLMTGNFLNSAEKTDWVMRRIPFWVVAIDPQPRSNSRFVSRNGQAKSEWVYHLVPLQGGEEKVLTMASNWWRDQMTPRLIQILQQTGQALGPAVLTLEIPPGGRRAMHTIRDWDQNPQPAAAQSYPQAMAQATAVPAYVPPVQQFQAQPQASVSAAPPPVIPWTPAPGTGIRPQAPTAAQAPTAVASPPSPPPAPATPPPASPGPTLEGGRPVGLGPDGLAPIQYACGCLATRTTRQVYQPCAIHAQNPNAAIPTGPPAAQMVSNPPIAVAAPPVPQARTGRGLCNRCQQQITGEVSHIGENDYLLHTNCPAATNPAEQVLIRV